MRTGQDTGRLEAMTVLVDRADEEGTWQHLVTGAGRLVGLPPSFLTLPATGGGWASAVVQAAAATLGPVLVLPRQGGPAVAGPERQSRLGCAVVASDGSWDVTGAARLCALHLLRSGVRTTVLVVLTGETAPPMWEGTGHHAAAWRVELGRRHGRPDHLDVVAGSPGPSVRDRAVHSDLLVLLWRRQVAAGRAAVLHEVLDDGVVTPTLLLPLEWVERTWARGPALASAL